MYQIKKGTPQRLARLVVIMRKFTNSQKVAYEDREEIIRVTVPIWDGIKSGESVKTGYSGQTLTAPTEPGMYRLYEEVYSDTNTHAGFVFKKIGD